MPALALVERGDAAAKGDEGVAAGSLDRLVDMPRARSGFSSRSCCSCKLGYRNAPMEIVEAKQAQQGGSHTIVIRCMTSKEEGGRGSNEGGWTMCDGAAWHDDAHSVNASVVLTARAAEMKQTASYSSSISVFPLEVKTGLKSSNSKARKRRALKDSAEKAERRVKSQDFSE